LLKKPNVPVIALEEHDADPGAAVTERIYPGMGHTVNADEIGAVRKLLAALATDPADRR
jgi:hypothetical protein